MKYVIKKINRLGLEMYVVVFEDKTVKTAYSIQGARSEVLKKGISL